MHRVNTVGVDDMAAYIPNLYLPIEDLASARDLEYAKLNKGLGLTAMSVPDAHEDVATMAANAVLELLQRNALQPEQIGRIYMGTESALDGSKPMATYVQDMLNQYFEPTHGEGAFLNCDVVDMTFACIGAVDALQNTLDWVRGGADRIGIVVGSDVARYELNSGGEYTQGAGAIAVLVRQQPRLLAFEDAWGVASRPVHDFFKPVRRFSKKQIIEEVLQLADVTGVDAEALLAKLETGAPNSILHHDDAHVDIHRDTPVFDGPYSNDCYQQRIGEAMQHYAEQEHLPEKEPVTDDWHRMVFHLPYAYQARRMFSEIFREESLKRGDWERTAALIDQAWPDAADFESDAAHQKAVSKYLRAITKTDRYRKFVAEKIEKGERASSLVGNLYTSSLFLSLMSTLEADLEEAQDLTGKKIGFFAYGSGSKSKVFAAIVGRNWKAVAEQFGLNQKLAERRALDYATYEDLHRGQQTTSVAPPEGTFYLKAVNREPGVQEGARAYGWQPYVKVPATATQA